MQSHKHRYTYALKHTGMKTHMPTHSTHGCMYVPTHTHMNLERGGLYSKTPFLLSLILEIIKLQFY